MIINAISGAAPLKPGGSAPGAEPVPDIGRFPVSDPAVLAALPVYPS